MAPLTEAQENTLRVLLAQWRRQDPAALVECLAEVVIANIPAEAAFAQPIVDGDDIRVAVVIVAKGVRTATRALEAVGAILPAAAPASPPADDGRKDGP